MRGSIFDSSGYGQCSVAGPCVSLLNIRVLLVSNKYGARNCVYLIRLAPDSVQWQGLVFHY